jgi:hypothetical protein
MALGMLLTLLAAAAQAEIRTAPSGAFSFTLSGDMKGTPAEVFAAATGDITPWWDHTMSGDPLKMYVEPVLGGAFMEIFNEQGDGVRHAVVTGVVKNEMLRYEGPLGLAGHALHMVTTWTFAPAGEGRTTVSVEVHGAGEVHDGWPEVIEKTWRHFLFERLQVYLEG